MLLIVGEKIRLFLTDEQVQQFKKYSGASRFIYNTCLAECIRAYQEDGISLKKLNLIKYAESLKYDEKYSWLKEISSGVVRVAAQDVASAFNNFYKRGNKGFPRFKKKGKCKESFGLKADLTHCRFEDSKHLKFSKIREPVQIREHWIPDKMLNPRVSFDGKFWYFSFSYEIPDADLTINQENKNITGVDLGIKSLAVTSGGVIYKNINKSKRVKQLEKRKRHLQRKLSRKYQMNKEDSNFVKTNNIIKLEQEIRLIDRKLKNIRNTYIHQVTYDLVKTKPACIVIEDLNVKGMMKNKHLSKAIQQQEFYKFRQYISYKCQGYGVRLVVANRFYPSSKTCSCCGHKKKFLSLKERTYICHECGLVTDRNLNAAINLKIYGKEKLIKIA